MGGHFAQHYTWSNQLRVYRPAAPARNLQPRHNIAPTVPLELGRVKVEKPLKDLRATFNARFETWPPATR